MEPCHLIGESLRVAYLTQGSSHKHYRKDEPATHRQPLHISELTNQ
jgi:hypothetical protein